MDVVTGGRDSPILTPLNTLCNYNHKTILKIGFKVEVIIKSEREMNFNFKNVKINIWK